MPCAPITSRSRAARTSGCGAPGGGAGAKPARTGTGRGGTFRFPPLFALGRTMVGRGMGSPAVDSGGLPGKGGLGTPDGGVKVGLGVCAGGGGRGAGQEGGIALAAGAVGVAQLSSSAPHVSLQDSSAPAQASSLPPQAGQASADEGDVLPAGVGSRCCEGRIASPLPYTINRIEMQPKLRRDSGPADQRLVP